MNWTWRKKPRALRKMWRSSCRIAWIRRSSHHMSSSHRGILSCLRWYKVNMRKVIGWSLVDSSLVKSQTRRNLVHRKLALHSHILDIYLLLWRLRSVHIIARIIIENPPLNPITSMVKTSIHFTLSTWI